MNWSRRTIAFYAILVALLLNLVVVSAALVWLITNSSSSSAAGIGKAIDAHLKAHPKVVQDIFLDILKNPQGAQQAAAAAEAAGADAPAADKAKIIAANEKALLYSPHQVVLGNRNGKVSLVLFFDYNCGFCRRAHGDMLGVMKANPDLRVVIKEYPILGEASVEAAKVAIALRMQDPEGRKYDAFHEKLISGGKVDMQVAKDAARAVGADMARLSKDLSSSEIDSTLRENFDLGTKLGVDGTPSYVVGKELIVGAVGQKALQTVISQQKKS